MVVKTRKTLGRIVATAGLIAPTLLGISSATAAVIDCTTSPYVVNAGTGNVTLNSSDVIRSTSGTTACVELRDGRNLNLNGATIECVNATGRCGHAVVGFSSGSVIENGYIAGDFNFGALDVATVRNLTITDGVSTGVFMGSLGRTVSGNVITDVYYGVVMGSAATATYYVHDNFFDNGIPDWLTSIYGYAISGTGTSGSGPRIEKNFIKNFAGGGIQASGYCGGTRNVRITDNVIDDVTGTEIDTGCSSATLTNNHCDDLTVCPYPTHPFTMP